MYTAITIVSFFILTQFLFVIALLIKRIRNGYNGLSKHLLAVVSILASFIFLDSLREFFTPETIILLYPTYGNLRIFELIILTSLLVSNTFLFIALRAESSRPIKKMTYVREKLYKSLERED